MGLGKKISDIENQEKRQLLLNENKVRSLYNNNPLKEQCETLTPLVESALNDLENHTDVIVDKVENIENGRCDGKYKVTRFLIFKDVSKSKILRWLDKNTFLKWFEIYTRGEKLCTVTIGSIYVNIPDYKEQLSRYNPEDIKAEVTPLTVLMDQIDDDGYNKKLKRAFYKIQGSTLHAKEAMEWFENTIIERREYLK